MASAPAPSESLVDEESYGETVTASEVVTSIYVSAVGGACFLICWAIFRKPLRHIFLKRTQLPDAQARPPPLCFDGLLNICFGYIPPVFFINDLEFVQTAGLDALILCRFLVLGFQIFLPMTIVCCAVLLPLCMTGTYVDTSYATNLVGIMRYTLSNIQPGSSKLWAPFVLSYAVLAWTGYCLIQHYKSYAMLRLLHLRHNSLHAAGGAPRMHIVGFERRGWAAVRDSLWALSSPLYMMRRDMRYVKQYLEQNAAAEAAATLDAAREAKDSTGAGDGGKGLDSDGDDQEYAKAAVLPWWLPPEKIPAQYSVERSSGAVLHGKTSPINRKRVLSEAAAGQPPVWVCVEQYSVLFTIAGPPPSSELWRLLRPAPAPAPEAVLVDAAKAVVVVPARGDGGKPGVELSSPSHTVLLQSGDGQKAGKGAEFVAAKLAQALQDIFPDSFTQLVRVYNHKAVDKLLSQHEAAASHRDRCVTALAAARGKADAAQGKGGAAKAAARLERAEAELAKAEERVGELEGQVEVARQAALEQPLGTAFIALFSDQTSAALAAFVQASFVPAINFNVRPCPGPDNINWMALWTPWGQRMLRALYVIPFLVLVIVFPIGVLTGALTNLSTAVCSGSSQTNNLYWPWYCEGDDAGSKFLKEILEGLLPSIISMTWDTYVLPMAFFFSSQSEARHLALSDLDHRVVILFFCFDIFNTFLGSVLGGAVFQQIGSLTKEPGYWLQMLGAALPSASTYFLNYIIIHALCTNFFRFIWPHEGTVLFVIFRWLGMCLPKCERDHTMIRTAPSFRGGRHFGSFQLIMIMALSYAVIAPLVLPAALGFFLTAWVTWRYCCIYFYERSYESGGRIFETLFTLMVWTLVLFSLFTSLVLASKKSYTASLILIFTQPPLLLVYHRRVSLAIGHYARLLPLQATLSAPRATPDPAAFLPPPLRKQAVGWYPEWGKVWEKYGISRYSL